MLVEKRELADNNEKKGRGRPRKGEEGTKTTEIKTTVDNHKYSKRKKMMIDEDDNEDNDNEYEKVIHQKTTKQTSYKGPMTRSRKNDTGLTNTGKLLLHGG